VCFLLILLAFSPSLFNVTGDVRQAAKTAIAVRAGRTVESLPLFSSQGSGGPANIPEFGTVTNAAGLADLYDMDTIQHVKKGTQYPAVLVPPG
jgi:hypothetical protein